MKEEPTVNVFVTFISPQEAEKFSRVNNVVYRKECKVELFASSASDAAKEIFTKYRVRQARFKLDYGYNQKSAL